MGPSVIRLSLFKRNIIKMGLFEKWSKIGFWDIMSNTWLGRTPKTGVDIVDESLFKYKKKIVNIYYIYITIYIDFKVKKHWLPKGILYVLFVPILSNICILHPFETQHRKLFCIKVSNTWRLSVKSFSFSNLSPTKPQKRGKRFYRLNGSTNLKAF